MVAEKRRIGSSEAALRYQMGKICGSLTQASPLPRAHENTASHLRRLWVRALTDLGSSLCAFFLLFLSSTATIRISVCCSAVRNIALSFRENSPMSEIPMQYLWLVLEKYTALMQH